MFLGCGSSAVCGSTGVRSPASSIPAARGGTTGTLTASELECRRSSHHAARVRGDCGALCKLHTALERTRLVMEERQGALAPQQHDLARGELSRRRRSGEVLGLGQRRHVEQVRIYHLSTCIRLVSCWRHQRGQELWLQRLEGEPVTGLL